MARFTACGHCGELLRENGRNWVHADGFFRCTSQPIGRDGDGFADPLDVVERKDLESSAFERGYAEGHGDCVDAIRSAIDL